MKKNLFYFLSAFMLIFAAGCSDMEDVTPAVDQHEAEATDQILQETGLENLRVQKIQGKGLKNLKVEGELENGADFKGMVTITSFSYDAEKGLLANGELMGIVTALDGKKRTHVKETFSDIPTTLANGTAPVGGEANEMLSAQAECQILFLDIGPIFLDLLGLQVDLSQIILDVTAVGGSGNLLGNLLCAVAGLLDPLSGLLAFLEFLGNLLDLIGQINELLGGL